VEKLNRLEKILYALRYNKRLDGEALRLIDEIREELIDINPSRLSRLSIPSLEKLASLVSDAEAELTALSSLVQRGRVNEAIEKLPEAVKKIAKLYAVRSMVSINPNIVPTAGYISTVETTPVVKQCGPIAARIYGFLVRMGRASSGELAEFVRSNRISVDDAERAMQCMVKRELVTVEGEGGEIYYRPVVG